MKAKIPTILKISYLHLAELLFLLGLLLKQFYLRRSGTIQISDVIVMLSAMIVIISGRTRFHRIDLELSFFVICTVIVNGSYAFYYNFINPTSYNYKFLLASAYLMYNLIVVIAFRTYIQDLDFVKALMTTMKLNLLTQLIIYFAGIGRMYGGLRYQGSFNDPNQFGFFVLCCFFMLFLCGFLLEKKVHAIWFMIVAFLILNSASRGMSIAFLIFLFFAVIQPFLATKTPLTRFICCALFVAIVCFILFGGMSILSLVLNSSGGKVDFLIQRFESRSVSGSLKQKILMTMKERQMARFFSAPYGFAFGGGEGYWARFLEVCTDSGEVHGSMLGLWYYYGIVPYCVLLRWLRNNTRGIPSHVWGVFIAIIFEAFTLANHRQPLFWMMFVMGSYIAQKSTISGERIEAIEPKI